MELKYFIILCLLITNCSSPFRTVIRENTKFKVPVYYCRRKNSNIEIDGIINKKEWEKAKTIKKFFNTFNGDTPELKTIVKCLYDDDALYISFHCEDYNIIAPVKTRDGDLFNHDVVEIFVDPDGEGKHYMELEVSPYNYIYDSQVDYRKPIDFEKAKSWNSDKIKTSVKIIKNKNRITGWNAEIRIPFTEFYFYSKRTKEWRINFYRIDRITAEKKLRFWAWSPTSAWFHIPEKFGFMIFE